MSQSVDRYLDMLDLDRLNAEIEEDDEICKPCWGDGRDCGGIEACCDCLCHISTL